MKNNKDYSHSLFLLYWLYQYNYALIDKENKNNIKPNSYFLFLNNLIL